jgi:DNA polymerase-4
MRWIFHIDMDAFYASIEQRDNPELRGRPVIVGGTRRRGVVAAASYEVREFGVHSAMPMTQALRRCPDAVVLPPRIDDYARESARVMEVFDRYSPQVEPLSLDEAFLDMTGTEKLFGPPVPTAQQIKDDIAAATDGLTSSVGIAPNKFLAKLASDLDKPDGITIIHHGDEASFIAPLPIRKIWGVGKKTAARMEELGFVTIADVAATDERQLVRLFGKSFGPHLHALARGIDGREVAGGGGKRKSVGSETTLSYDIAGRGAVERVLRKRCETVARHLRRKELRAGAIRVKVRYTETFSLQTRQASLPAPADDSRTLFDAARKLLDGLELDEPIRLVGAAAYDLMKSDDVQQLSLFGQSSEESSRLEHTMDAIRARFGDKIQRGRGD